MPITAVDKMKINKYLKDNAIGDIYYQDMCDALGKKVKITDVEFLEYFTDLIVAEFSKDVKINSKQTTKIISVIEAFLGWIHEAGTEVSEELLDKIRSFSNLYEDYLERSQTEKDEELIIPYMNSLLENINSLYPNETNTDSLSKYVTIVAELKNEIKRLTRELEEAQKLNEINSKTIEEKHSRIQTLSNDLVNSNCEVSAQNRTITELEKTVKELEDRAEKLETELLSSKMEVNELSPYKYQCETLTRAVESLSKQIEDETKAKKKLERLQTKETKIEALMYEYILTHDANLDEIVNYVKTHGTSTDPKQVADLLRRMKNKINIETTRFSMQPRYKITAPSIETNKRFEVDVPSNCKVYDIMLVADYHLEEFTPKVLHALDELHDYCAKTGINLILNIGDLFNGYDFTNFKYENAIANYRFIEKAIQEIPYQPNLYQAILSGNHERNILKYGINPVKMLADAREDIIDLGFTHSTIELASPEGKIGEFGIHHPNTFDFPIDFEETGLDFDQLRDYIKRVYEEQGRDRSNTYIDIFGHTHKSQFNYRDSYCYIPSLMEGRSKRGACHLKVYINDKNEIDYMVFMPLSFNTSNKLARNNEIVYEKVLSR